MANQRTKKPRRGKQLFLAVMIDPALLAEVEAEAERMRGADPSANRSRAVRSLIRDGLDARKRAARAS